MSAEISARSVSRTEGVDPVFACLVAWGLKHLGCLCVATRSGGAALPAIERDWEVIIAGEGHAIGTVRAADEATARSLAIELAKIHCRNVGAAFDPSWVHVRAGNPGRSG